MPKMKSHSGAKKRIKKTGTGKWKAKSPGTRHLNAGWAPKIGRRKRRLKTVGAVESKSLARFLPYA